MVNGTAGNGTVAGWLIDDGGGGGGGMTAIPLADDVTGEPTVEG